MRLIQIVTSNGAMMPKARRHVQPHARGEQVCLEPDVGVMVVVVVVVVADGHRSIMRGPNRRPSIPDPADQASEGVDEREGDDQEEDCGLEVARIARGGEDDGLAQALETHDDYYQDQDRDEKIGEYRETERDDFFQLGASRLLPLQRIITLRATSRQEGR
jgi:hypothetical protein